MKKVLFSFLAITLVLASCKNYDDEFDDLNASIANLQSQVSSLSTLQSDLTTIQNTVNSLQTTLDGTEVDLSEILTEIALLQTDLNALTTDFSEADLSALQENLNLLQEDVDEILESQNVDSLILNLSGLDELGDDFVYEGWLIVNGSPVSTGTFSSIDFPQSFMVNKSDLELAVKFVLSIEPAVDSDPAPAATKILAGDFSGDTASVSSNGIVADLSNSTGTYILATPTDGGADTNEESGVWFLDNSSGSPMKGLNLPTLSNGWKYEGWAVIDGNPISTGTFTDAGAADDNASTSAFKGDAGDGPNYPGEDYLQNAPSGLTFPTDLKGATIVVSVEPYPDNSPNPFTLKPLAHMVPSNAANHSAITMGTGPVVSLSGSVSR